MEIFPSCNDTFFAKDSFLRLRVERDAAGKVVRLRVSDWGDEPFAVRDEAPAKPARTAITLDPATYDAYVGEYELTPGFILTVTREGTALMTQAAGRAKVEVFPSSPTEFFLKVVDAQITFVKDASGAVTQLVLHKGDATCPRRRSSRLSTGRRRTGPPRCCAGRSPRSGPLEARSSRPATGARGGGC